MTVGSKIDCPLYAIFMELSVNKALELNYAQQLVNLSEHTMLSFSKMLHFPTLQHCNVREGWSEHNRGQRCSAHHRLCNLTTIVTVEATAIHDRKHLWQKYNLKETIYHCSFLEMPLIRQNELSKKRKKTEWKAQAPRHNSKPLYTFPRRARCIVVHSIKTKVIMTSENSFLRSPTSLYLFKRNLWNMQPAPTSFQLDYMKTTTHMQMYPKWLISGVDQSRTHILKERLKRKQQHPKRTKETCDKAPTCVVFDNEYPTLSLQKKWERIKN